MFSFNIFSNGYNDFQIIKLLLLCHAYQNIR